MFTQPTHQIGDYACGHAPYPSFAPLDVIITALLPIPSRLFFNRIGWIDQKRKWHFEPVLDLLRIGLKVQVSRNDTDDWCNAVAAAGKICISNTDYLNHRWRNIQFFVRFTQRGSDSVCVIFINFSTGKSHLTRMAA